MADSAVIYYVQLGISLIVREIYLDPISGLPGASCPDDIDKYLDALNAWRGAHRPASTGLGHWHSLTNCFPAPGTVGLAHVGTLCGRHATAVSSMYGYNPSRG